eukprot:3559520-Amphidinium_carterae.1
MLFGSCMALGRRERRPDESMTMKIRQLRLHYIACPPCARHAPSDLCTSSTGRNYWNGHDPLYGSFILAVAGLRTALNLLGFVIPRSVFSEASMRPLFLQGATHEFCKNMESQSWKEPQTPHANMKPTKYPIEGAKPFTNKQH